MSHLLTETPLSFGHEGQIGNLADGGDDGVHVEREIGTLDGDGLLPAAPVELAELHPLAGDAADLAALFHDLDRGGEKFDLDPLLFGGDDLLDGRGHLLALAAVEDRHVGAETGRAAGRVDGGVAAADDRDLRSRGSSCPSSRPLRRH